MNEEKDNCNHKLGDKFRLEVEGHCTYCNAWGLLNEGEEE